MLYVHSMLNRNRSIDSNRVWTYLHIHHMVLIVVSNDQPPNSLDNCFSEIAQTPAIQKWIYGRIHEYQSCSKVPFFRPRLV